MADHSHDDAFPAPKPLTRRIFFDVYEAGRVIRDEVGSDCATLEEVSARAVAALPEMARDVVPDGEHREISVRARDEEGRGLLRASLRLMIEHYD